MKEVLEVLRRDHLKLGIDLHPGESLRMIMDFEERMNVRLPRDFKRFYQLCNGFHMAEEDVFNIIPLSEILENSLSTPADHQASLASSGDFHFAEYLIYSDMWTVCINPQSNNQYAIYNKGEQLVTLTYSLSDFLFLLLKKGLWNGIYARMAEKSG